MTKINYENICKEQLFKNVHSVTPISKCNQLVKIECVCDDVLIRLEARRYQPVERE